MKCLNCNQSVEGKFCSNCGQKSSTHRLSLKHLFDYGFLFGVLSLNKGLLFTIKQLFTSPGDNIRDYINGQRIKYYNPFGLLLILVTILYIIDEYFGRKLKDVVPEDLGRLADDLQQLKDRYRKLVYLINIPFMSLLTYMLFRKSKFNLAENIILNTYTSAAQIIIYIPFLLIITFYNDSNNITILKNIVLSIYSIWVYYQFFSKSNYKKSTLIFKCVMSVIICFFIRGIITSAGVILIRFLE